MIVWTDQHNAGPKGDGMKTSLIILTLMTSLSCRTTHFKGGMATTDAPKGDKVPTEGPTVELPVTSETSVLQGTAKEQPLEVETPMILTLSVSKLKHDALDKNCLSITVDGQRHAIACNKDFMEIPPKVIALTRGSACRALLMTMDSFKPVDQAVCIQKIQANRQNHVCDYQKEAFRSSAVPDPLRFKATVVEGSSEAVRKLDIAFEDGQDADYNDYVFSISAGEGTYLVNRDGGVEYCLSRVP